MRFSIVTINLNNINGLKETLDSVFRQRSYGVANDCVFEHIIVDGGSNDGSKDVIEDYAKRVKYPVKWVSEKDEGIYNAMNKGTRMSIGDYLLFLNSGDTLANNTVIEDLLSEILTADIIIGRINVVSEGKIVTKDATVFGDEVGLFGLLLRGIPHQGTLISRALQEKCPYDEKYRINSDFKFFLNTVIMHDCSVQYLSLTIANYDNGGFSVVNSQLQIQERSEIFRDTIPHRICKEYEFWIPHYYELIRVKWLLKHPFFYYIYRVWTSVGMRIIK